MQTNRELQQYSIKRHRLKITIKIVILVLLIFYGILSDGYAQNATENQSLLNDLDSIRKAYNIPGLSFGVATGDQVLITGALGIREIHTTDSVAPNDYFNFGSMGKSLTSFITGKLVDEGKIEWDTRFFDLFPELKNSSQKEYLSLSIRDLLSMRTSLISINRLGVRKIIKDYNLKYKDDRLSYYKFAEYALTLKPIKFKSGQLYNYTSMSYILANLMIEKVSGLTYSQLIEKTNKDLGINFIIGWPQQLGKCQPRGHLIPNDFGLSNSKKMSVFNGNQMKGWLKDWFYYLIPSGNHSVSIADYLKYLQLNMNGLNGQNNYLNASTYNFIFNGAQNYAMGWVNGVLNGNHYYHHTGSTGNFMARAIINKELDITIAVLINAANQKSHAGLYQIIQYLEEKFI